MARSRNLDILRILAVFLVLGRHLEVFPKDSSALLHTITRIWHEGGWIGVDLFFVLSGFLVSGLLFKEQQSHQSISIKRFLIRRGFKIYPAFYALIAVTLVRAEINGFSYDLKLVLPEVLFLQNYVPGIWNHTWTLATEEHFYLLIVVLIALLLRYRSKPPQDPFGWLPGIFIAVTAICLLLRVYTWSAVQHVPIKYLSPTHLRLDSLFFGVILSYYYHYRPEAFNRFRRRYKGWLLALGLVALAPPFFLVLGQSFYLATIGLTVFYLGSGALLIFALGEDRQDRLSRLLAYLGAHSYSIYLWHMPVALWITRVFQRRMGEQWGLHLHYIVYLAGSIVLGLLMAYIVERPALKLRDRLFPSRSTREPTSQRPTLIDQPMAAEGT